MKRRGRGDNRQRARSPWRFVRAVCLVCLSHGQEEVSLALWELLETRFQTRRRDGLWLHACTRCVAIPGRQRSQTPLLCTLFHRSWTDRESIQPRPRQCGGCTADMFSTKHSTAEPSNSTWKKLWLVSEICCSTNLYLISCQFSWEKNLTEI